LPLVRDPALAASTSEEHAPASPAWEALATETVPEPRAPEAHEEVVVVAKKKAWWRLF